MPKGISLHIGVNVVDVNHYGKENRLYGCNNDALAMQKIADDQGFESSVLLDDQATTRSLIQGITDAANTLQSGDMFFITFSGHGGQVPDGSGDEGGNDETLCLFDRQYRDDEFNRQLARFAEGVKILWVSDSCHATNNFRNLEDEEEDAPPARTLGLDNCVEVVKRNKSDYEDWLEGGDFMRQSTPKISASLLQLAACKEEQLSRDAFEGDPDPKGMFTKSLLGIWNEGDFNATYQELIDEIVKVIPAYLEQTPQMIEGGTVDSEFAKQKPFTI